MQLFRKQKDSQSEKQIKRSRSPIQRFQVKQKSEKIEEVNVEQQIEFANQMIDQGVQHFQQKKFTLAKIVLVHGSQILFPLIKTDKIIEQDKPQALQKVTLAIKYAEQCNNEIENLQKQLAQSDPYSKQIIETAMIRKANVTFNDIIGLEETKNQLEEAIVLPNLRPDIFSGIRAPPKGILFYGPPGNGKTLLAKAVANQIKCCFFNISASTLVQKHLGEGEKLMKTLFGIAFRFQPSVIFIDEIDSILSSRSSEEHEASRRLKTEFLVSFDGMQTSDQDRVYLIAATNRPQDIDAAVLRRFTVKILIDQPDEKARLALVKQLLSNVQHSLLEGSFRIICQKLKGYSASDIKAVVKEACMQPLREGKGMLMSISTNQIRPVRLEDFQEALNKVQPTLTEKQYQEYISFNQQGK